MKALQDRSIRQKITLVIMLISGLVLMLACVSLFAYQAWTIKKRFVSELSVTAEMIASNLAVATMFKDEEKASEILSGLSTMPQIISATVDLADGTRLAHFGNEGDGAGIKTAMQDSALHVDGNRVLLATPVKREGRTYGTLHLHADFHAAYAGLMKLYGGMLGVVLAGSLILTYFLSGRFQHMVTAPILQLADTARQIAEGKDYSVRAKKAGSDEVGTLTDAFNQMLAQIHAQDTALQNAQQKLHEQLAALEREVEERKAAEEALHQSQEKLLETSRLAGKAEVATSVLHNVGNVLNSVNVSGNILSEKLRGSKVTILAKAANLINEHRANFAEFVASDPRGQRVPDLVSKISSALAEEQKELLAEVETITSHIGHIKQIVAMQQSYSRVGGVIEQLTVEDLVGDAIRMNAASMARHNVELRREYEKVPKLQLDRHKVLQILVNLFSNAKHAVDDSGREDKRVTVKIQNNGGHFVKISVEDNGVGIAQENLARIFAHGFTTKKTGHGFGLHSGALAAKEVGGSLYVHSDGPGAGAIFTLELPIVPAAVIAAAN